jgi:hypothetical protein
MGKYDYRFILHPRTKTSFSLIIPCFKTKQNNNKKTLFFTSTFFARIFNKKFTCGQLALQKRPQQLGMGQVLLKMLLGTGVHGYVSVQKTGNYSRKLTTFFK